MLDITEHRLRSAHPGGLREYVGNCFSATLRQLARRRQGSVVLGLRAVFQPDLPAYDRLTWFVRAASAHGTLADDDLASLTIHAPFSQIHPLTPLSSEPSWPTGLRGYAEVVRLETCVRPAVTQEDNPHVPRGGYYAAARLVPNLANDWLSLDRALAEGMHGRALIDLWLTPVSLGEEQTAWNHWWAALRKVNASDALDEQSAPYGWSETRAREIRVVRDPLADDFAREAQEQLTALRHPHVKFALRVLAETPERATALAAVVAEAAFMDDQYQLVGLRAEDPMFEEAVAAVREGRAYDDPCRPEVFGLNRPEELRERLPPGLQELRRVVRLATPSELAGVFRLPMSAGTAPRCMRRTTDPDPVPYRRPSPAGPIRSVAVGYDLEAGLRPRVEALASEEGLEALLAADDDAPMLRLDLELLKKHVFVAGTPGSGKTVAALNLLTQLHRAGIPWLVIEPAKTEYRVVAALATHPDPTVRRMAQEVRVLTPGNERLSPMRLNPFVYPEGGNRDEHIELLFACFKAAFPVFTPLDGLLLEALERAYDEVGTEGTPTLASLLRVAREVLRSKGYAHEVRSNLEGALDVRLGGLTRRSVGRVFSGGSSFPSMRELLAYPTVVELEHLGPDAAAFLALLLLSGMREHFRHAPIAEGGRHSGSALKHVTLIEEAHNLVGHTGSAPGDDVANPKYHAAQFVSRMLAEVRALGEALVIVDQLPSAVAPEVVKNTGIKYAGRLVSGDDRETMAAAMMLDPGQTEELARLGVGDAYLYHEKLHAPRRCAGLDAHRYLGLGQAPHGGDAGDLQEWVAGKGIRDILRDRAWFVDFGERLAAEFDEEVDAALTRVLETVAASTSEGPYLTIPALRALLEATHERIRARAEVLAERGGLTEEACLLIHEAFIRFDDGILGALDVVGRLKDTLGSEGDPQ